MGGRSRAIHGRAPRVGRHGDLPQHAAGTVLDCSPVGEAPPASRSGRNERGGGVRVASPSPTRRSTAAVIPWSMGADRPLPATPKGLRPAVEVARQCSNLAPSLQLAVSSHRAIRRRNRPAAVSPGSARALPRPVPRLTAAMLGEAERRYKDGEILRAIAGDLGVSRQRLAERLRERGVRLRGEKPSSEQVRERCACPTSKASRWPGSANGWVSTRARSG